MKSILITTVILALIFILFVPIHAQDIDTLWTNIYWNGSEENSAFDSANCVQETSDQGFIMVGNTKDMGDVQYNINLIKAYPNGEVEWSTQIGEGDNATGLHVLQTFDGGYLISAQSDNFTGAWDGRVWIVKTDASGAIDWTFEFTQIDGNGFPYHAIQTSDTGYAITGLINFNRDNDAFIIKLDKNGNYQWSQMYGEDGTQDGRFITQMDDGGYIIIGNSDDPYATGYDFRAFRTNAGGSVLWDSVYALSGSYDVTNDACVVEDGIVMTGQVYSSGHVHKIDFNGSTIWSKSIEQYFTGEEYHNIIATSDGGFMVGGWMWVAGHRRDHTFIKLNSVGNVDWVYTVGGPQDDHGQSIVETHDGGFAMVGTSSSFVNGSSFYLTKIIEYLCGDANNSGGVDVADAVYLINHIFRGGPPPELMLAANVNCDDSVNISDAVWMINHIFRAGAGPCECE